MAKKTTQLTVKTESKTKQMKTFCANHKGETFTATGLARSLGWSKKKTHKVKAADGKTTEEVTKVSHCTKSALRLAKKSGAKVTHGISLDYKDKGLFTIEI